MAHRNIEEVFRAIAPARDKGIPGAAPITVGIAGSGGADSATSMSQAAQEIAQLRLQYEKQAALIQANTQALQNNTAGSGGQSIGATIGHAASGILGGGLGFLSPIFSGILSLFGGGGSSQAPPPLPFYTPPPSVQIRDTLRAATPTQAPASAGTSPGSVSTSGSASAAPPASTPAPPPQITVNVSAMDSQSFMDRSSDIASAVRHAMLNLHPINDVVATL